MITHYRVWRDGSVRVINRPMTPAQRDFAVGDDGLNIPAARGTHACRMDTTTRDGRPLRVDWLAETSSGQAFAWFEEEAPLVHLASATAIVVNAENHALAMCGVDLGTDPVGHPWANYVTVGSEYWDKVTCDACKARVIDHRKEV